MIGGVLIIYTDIKDFVDFQIQESSEVANIIMIYKVMLSRLSKI
jgi:hypothetical protein